jgi:hypothetical protein
MSAEEPKARATREEMAAELERLEAEARAAGERRLARLIRDAREAAEKSRR